MTNAKWLIAVDTANVLMGNVFVPEDTQDPHASNVSSRKQLQSFCSRDDVPRDLAISRSLEAAVTHLCAKAKQKGLFFRLIN